MRRDGFESSLKHTTLAREMGFEMAVGISTLPVGSVKPWKLRDKETCPWHKHTATKEGFG